VCKIREAHRLWIGHVDHSLKIPIDAVDIPLKQKHYICNDRREAMYQNEISTKLSVRMVTNTCVREADQSLVMAISKWR